MAANATAAAKGRVRERRLTVIQVLARAAVLGYVPRMRPAQLVFLLLAALASAPIGCGGVGANLDRPIPADAIVFVPGASGDGAWYADLKAELARTGRPVVVHPWGAPAALFMLNFSDAGVHDRAEGTLAARLAKLPPAAHVVLVTHSAGGGVALGALAKTDCPPGVVDRVILLQPSVSPGYDVNPALAKSARGVVLFCSDRDTTFLKWRTSHFGGYDRVKSPAAGHAGFAPTTRPDGLAGKLTQIPYDPAWAALGHDGDHFGPTSGAFVRAVVVPLLEGATTRTSGTP
jgi:hypothetical protein